MVERPGTHETVVIAIFAYRHEGEMAQGFLTDADIESVLLVDDTGGLTIRLTIPGRLVVRKEDEAEARAILEELDILPGAAPPST
jgi:hypothetical protein